MMATKEKCNKKRLKCDFCKIFGHLITTCRNKKRKEKQHQQEQCEEQKEVILKANEAIKTFVMCTRTLMEKMNNLMEDLERKHQQRMEQQQSMELQVAQALQVLNDLSIKVTNQQMNTPQRTINEVAFIQKAKSRQQTTEGNNNDSGDDIGVKKSEARRRKKKIDPDLDPKHWFFKLDEQTEDYLERIYVIMDVDSEDEFSARRIWLDKRKKEPTTRRYVKKYLNLFRELFSDEEELIRIAIKKYSK